MKRKIIVLFGVLVVGMGFQAPLLKIRVQTPGSLVGRRDEKKQYTTREIVLEGLLNGADLRSRRRMAYVDRSGGTM